MPTVVLAIGCFRARRLALVMSSSRDIFGSQLSKLEIPRLRYASLGMTNAGDRQVDLKRFVVNA